jgi:U3 small nucleolar RNA-associated protein 15
MLPNSGMLASAGENYIKIWDLISGGRLIDTLSYHQKAITSLGVDGSGSRLISGGLDGFIKFYDVSSLALTHSMQYAGPILSVGISPDSATIAAGMVDGTLLAKQREKPSGVQELPHRFRSSAYSHFFRGAAYHGDRTDVVLENERKQHLQPYDAMLKAFQYGPALNAALQSGNPSIVVSLIDELIQRSGLRQALHNRDDASLEPILRFVVKYIANPSYSTYMADLALMLLEIYTPVIGQSPAVDQLLTQLTRRLTDELRLQDDCTVLQGELDLILASVVPDSNMSFEMND